MGFKQVVYFLSMAILIVACNGGGAGASVSNNSTVPVINQNNLNLIFTQTLEESTPNSNLSVKGFNHSLLLGQLINQITAGQVESIFAQEPFSNPNAQGIPSMSSAQSIENYAVLNTAPLNVVLDNNLLDVLSFINENIIANNLSGNYVFNLPAALINEVLGTMSISPTLYFNYTPISNVNQYVILSFDRLQSATATTYNDNLNPSNSYPQLNLKTGAQCLQQSYTFTTPTGDIPTGINTDETIYLMRHTNAHPVPRFENQNYVCQGQWRAIGANQAIYNAIGGLPDLVYSSDPAQMGSTGVTYVRPSLTVNPFTINYNLPLNLVPESQFAYTNIESFNQFFFFDHMFNNKTTLVAWEHDHIQASVEYLLTHYYNISLPTDFPVWAEDDYDTIYKLEFNNNGQLTFSNTCEGISNLSLPLSCPTFGN